MDREFRRSRAAGFPRSGKRAQFWLPTAGYASTNTIFRLFDGTQIVLTVGADVALRTGEVFCEEPIPPDVLTGSPEQEAAAWIRSRFKH